jgi:phage I-like protein
MARGAKLSKTATLTAKGRKPGRKTAVAAKAGAKAKSPTFTKVTAPAKRVSAASARAPAVSKDELRAQVAKLERANATLRAKGRDAGRAAKTAAARIAELEDQVARLSQQLAAQETAAGGSQPAASPKGRRRGKGREIDPGDAVPPGVAVEDHAALDWEAETARNNLEEHLRGE